MVHGSDNFKFNATNTNLSFLCFLIKVVLKSSNMTSKTSLTLSGDFTLKLFSLFFFFALTQSVALLCTLFAVCVQAQYINFIKAVRCTSQDNCNKNSASGELQQKIVPRHQLWFVSLCDRIENYSSFEFYLIKANKKLESCSH